MSALTPGIRRVRPPARGFRVAAAHRASLRVWAVAFAVGLDATAAYLVTTRRLPEAVAGIALAGLGWVVTGRLTAWRPRPSPAGGLRQDTGTE
ncbi:hypothetical protein [Streptomyces phaeochromogenes]|uniref:hypothetical protein n=1 Tax=Streptomyces phaeochromogenes TaxID=1923 RepID=UPI002DD8FF5D|nr:hypothetical protein [Streptomyces phaeochromogenes]WRZ34482.1 hypothetical protein OG931_45505 [Streptomyces phaeochromogenes]